MGGVVSKDVCCSGGDAGGGVVGGRDGAAGDGWRSHVNGGGRGCAHVARKVAVLGAMAAALPG